MICPVCGKLSADSDTLCMYCGTPRIKLVPSFRNTGKFRDHPEEQAGRVYEIHDTTEFEWSCYVERKSVGKTPVADDSRTLPDPHEQPRVSNHNVDCQQPPSDQQLPLHRHDLEPQEMQETGECSLQPAPNTFASSPVPCSEDGTPPQLEAPLPDHEKAPLPCQAEPQKSSSISIHPPETLSSSQKKRVRMVSEIEMLKTVLAGSYDVIRTLGTGGMATVYLAHETALDRDVAIKVLPQAFTHNKQFVNRFKREARIAARLEHPNIVRIYRIGEEPGLCCFVMSYIPGGTIADRIKDCGHLPTGDIVRWGIDACAALGYAHERGVIHRDLKPDNIMLDYDNRAIVMDFGIAHAVEGTNLTKSGALVGTPQYMSPDQAMGRELDARSDIYSFGMVLYKMAAGKLPFKSKDPLSLMYMHVNKTPQPPDVLNPLTPHWLSDIILTCIAKRPEDRFGSAYELRDALMAHNNCLQGTASFDKHENPHRTGSSLITAAANILSGAFSGIRVRR